MRLKAWLIEAVDSFKALAADNVQVEQRTVEVQKHRIYLCPVQHRSMGPVRAARSVGYGYQLMLQMPPILAVMSHVRLDLDTATVRMG